MELTVEFEDGNKTKFFEVVKFHTENEAKEMNFSEAVKALKMGNKVRRLSWPERRYLWTDKGVTIWMGKDGIWKNPEIADFEALDWWIVTDLMDKGSKKGRFYKEAITEEQCLSCKLNMTNEQAKRICHECKTGEALPD